MIGEKKERKAIITIKMTEEEAVSLRDFIYDNITWNDHPRFEDVLADFWEALTAATE